MKWILPILLFSICPCIQAVKNEVVFEEGEEVECISGPYKGKTAVIEGLVKEFFADNNSILTIGVPNDSLNEVCKAYQDPNVWSAYGEYLQKGGHKPKTDIAGKFKKFFKDKSHPTLESYFKEPVYCGYIGTKPLYDQYIDSGTNCFLKASWLAKKK